MVQNHPVVLREASDKQCVVLDGETMTCISKGNPDAPPVILLHGWLMHAGVWHSTMDTLAQKYHCIAIDLLGHGHSDKPARGDYSIPTQARRVIKLVDHLGIGTFSIIGHSMGAMIAMHLAAGPARGRIRRVVDVAGIVDHRVSLYLGLVVAPTIFLRALLPPLWPHVYKFMQIDLIRATLNDRLLYHHYRSRFTDPDVMMTLMPGMEIAAVKAALAILRYDLSDLLPDIIAPTLIIFGADDNTVPLMNAHTVHERVPDSRLMILAECGHLPMVEQTEIYLSAVCGFLDEEYS